MARITNRRAASLTGAGVILTAVVTLVVVHGGSSPEESLTCADDVGPPSTIDIDGHNVGCGAIGDPPTTQPPATTAAPDTTTTTMTMSPPGTFDDVPSEFDITTAGPYRSIGGTFPSSASEPSGNFRVLCEFSHVDYVDPILAPGSAAFPHLHMFWGNTLTDENSTYASLRSTGDSTCDGGPLNRTAYWMPAMFDSNDQVVVPELFIAYYKAETASDLGGLTAKQDYLRTTAEYPNGFRYLTNPNWASGATQGISWKCETVGVYTAGIPASCPSGSALVARAKFPHCWDGENLWLDGNAHVSYGNGDSEWTSCPPEFPVLLPSLTEFAHFPWASDIGQWKLSTDDMAPGARGHSWHADWFGAWDNTIQTTWLEDCLAGLRNSTSSLCDGTQLEPRDGYRGPDRLTGWTPMPS